MMYGQKVNTAWHLAVVPLTLPGFREHSIETLHCALISTTAHNGVIHDRGDSAYQNRFWFVSCPAWVTVVRWSHRDVSLRGWREKVFLNAVT